MADHDHVVVGLDGSPGSATALAWAAARTERFGPIQPVSAWQYPWWAVAPFSPGSLLPPPASTFHDDVRQVAEGMLADIDPALTRQPLTVHGQAGPALVDAATAASLLVVGTRGHGALADRVLGSVSMYCVHHATCPLAIVPADTPPEDRHARVVVGVDGTETSRLALRWALENTARSSAIEVVHAWRSRGATVAEVPALAEEHLESLASELLDDVLRSVDDVPGRADRALSARSAHGDARAVLSTASDGADLLVLGAGDHSGATSHLGGSVTAALAHRPSTTTVIVR